MKLFKSIGAGLLLLGLPLGAAAQGSQSLKINEVVVLPDSAGLIDEYGARSAWIEVANTSWGTTSLRNCYLTNNPHVLNPSLSAPERIALMSVLKEGDAGTTLKAKKMQVFFADGLPHRGVRHLGFTLKAGQPNFIALYEGNGTTLIDSITVPANLPAGCSYARMTDKDGNFTGWEVKQPADVTPADANPNGVKTEDKVREWKEKDPTGIYMSVLAMGIVFFCLLLLYVFFRLFGIVAQRWTAKGPASAPSPQTTTQTHNNENQPNDMNTLMAVIAMALHESQNAHDIESDRITIVAHPTDWNRRRF